MIIDKYVDLVDMIRSSFATEQAKIESNDKWTPEAKSQSLRELGERSNHRLESLRHQLADERETRSKTLEQKLFAVGDNPAIQMAYRDGITRASFVAGSEDELSGLMDQALDTNDSTLAKGVAFVAQKSGFFDVAARAFEGAYQKHFQEYMSIQSALANPVSREALEESFLFASVN